MKKYIYIIVGLGISILGYTLNYFYNFDTIRVINNFIYDLENKIFNKSIIIWLSIMLIFTVINIFVIYKRREEKQKEEVFKSMLYVSNHILRNLLQQMQLVRIEIIENSNFDITSIKMFDKSISEAEILLKKLSTIKSIKEHNIISSLDSSTKDTKIVKKSLADYF